MYSFTLALFVTAVGLAYHTVFILVPADLMNKRTPAIVAVISWFVLGAASGALVPITYGVWHDPIIATIVGICLVVCGATLGHIILGIARRKAQGDVRLIAEQMYKERRGEKEQTYRES